MNFLYLKDLKLNVYVLLKAFYKDNNKLILSINILINIIFNGNNNKFIKYNFDFKKNEM
jgi:hypothetical protein